MHCVQLMMILDGVLPKLVKRNYIIKNLSSYLKLRVTDVFHFQNNKTNHTKISIISVNFSLNDDFKPDESVNFSFNVAIDSGDKRGSKFVDAIVVVKTPEKEDAGNLPFYFSVTGRGTFSFSKELSEKEIDLFKNVNCPAIIYPYIRELVADLTRRSGFSPLHLPPVNFVKMHKEQNSNN